MRSRLSCRRLRLCQKPVPESDDARTLCRSSGGTPGRFRSPRRGAGVGRSLGGVVGVQTILANGWPVAALATPADIHPAGRLLIVRGRSPAQPSAIAWMSATPRGAGGPPGGKTDAVSSQKRSPFQGTAGWRYAVRRRLRRLCSIGFEEPGRYERCWRIQKAGAPWFFRGPDGWRLTASLVLSRISGTAPACDASAARRDKCSGDSAGRAEVCHVRPATLRPLRPRLPGSGYSRVTISGAAWSPIR